MRRPIAPRQYRLNLRLNRVEISKIRRAARTLAQSPGTCARDAIMRFAEGVIKRASGP